MWVSCLIC